VYFYQEAHRTAAWSQDCCMFLCLFVYILVLRTKIHTNSHTQTLQSQITVPLSFQEWLATGGAFKRARSISLITHHIFISSQQCISAGLLHLLLFTSAICSAAPSMCSPLCNSWQTNTTARKVYSGLKMMWEMGRTLPTGTPTPTASVSVV